VEPVALIIAALAAGAASTLEDAKLSDDAKASIETSFARLRELVARRFKNPAVGELILEKYANAPETWENPLRAELSESEAASDPVLVGAAQEVFTLLDKTGARVGKYVITILLSWSWVRCGYKAVACSCADDNRRIRASPGFMSGR
jgi:hypothetical protein